MASELDCSVKVFEDNFKDSMDDDFNSARAIGDIFELVKNINNIIQKPDFEINASLKKSLRDAYEKIIELGMVLGLNFKKEVSRISENIGNQNRNNKRGDRETDSGKGSCQKKRDYRKADEIRIYLHGKGIILEDRKEGTIWELKDSRR